MAYTGPSISLHVKITVAPEHVQAFLAECRPVYEAVTAEPENTFFEVYHLIDQPGTFKIVENWNATRDWLENVQLKKPYYEPYIAKTEPMWIKPREFEFWDRMDGNRWVSVKKELTEKTT